MEETESMDADRWSAVEAAYISTERRAIEEEACIAAYAVRLKRRDNPPRRGQHSSKSIYAMSQQSRALRSVEEAKMGSWCK